ncbi:MAG: phage integrase N-terminal domain-containing protein [Methylophilus sp.]|uniref:phage integrase N-terminal domain-containing protein n=1 Tax=Methylophilus sp. TaxID=29541 RepID=UPI003FA07357
MKEILTGFERISFNRSYKVKVSHRTIQKRRDVMYLSFETLRKGGFKINDPLNIKPKHIEYLVSFWVSEQLSASTISNRVSIINIFLKFIGKEIMVKSPQDYVDDPKLVKRTYVNTEDKSWSAKELDFADLVVKASDIDVYSSMHLELMLAFGLRVQESISLQPFKSDYTNYLLVMHGTKGGRTRIVHIDSGYKADVLKRAKALCGDINRNMSNPDRTLMQEINRLYYVMKKLGITKSGSGATPHGLRHQYLNDRYEEVAGHASPVRGGVIVDKEIDEQARLFTMLEAGHGRTNVGVNYYGSAKQTKQPS